MAELRRLGRTPRPVRGGRRSRRSTATAPESARIHCDLLGAGGLVDRDGDRAGRPDRVVEQRPLVPGAAHQRDPVAGPMPAAISPRATAVTSSRNWAQVTSRQRPPIWRANCTVSRVLLGVVPDRIGQVGRVADSRHGRHGELAHFALLIRATCLKPTPVNWATARQYGLGWHTLGRRRYCSGGRDSVAGVSSGYGPGHRGVRAAGGRWYGASSPTDGGSSPRCAGGVDEARSRARWRCGRCRPTRRTVAGRSRSPRPSPRRRCGPCQPGRRLRRGRTGPRDPGRGLRGTVAAEPAPGLPGDAPPRCRT